MYDELRTKAISNLEKRNIRKKKVTVVGVIFAAISILLIVVSLNADPTVRYWVRFPIFIFGLVYAIIYVSALGLPFVDMDSISEEEIEREIVKIYKLSGLNGEREQLDLQEDELALEELEEMTKRVEGRDDYV